jgi:hypothetical protein
LRKTACFAWCVEPGVLNPKSCQGFKEGQKLLNDLNETLDQRRMTVQMPSCLESFANLTRLAAATPAGVVDAAFNFQKTKEVSRMWEKIIDDEFTAYRQELEADRQRLIAAGFISGENQSMAP